MAVHDFKELIRILPPKKRLLALDHGKKTIGLAVCDADLRIASPLHTIKSTKFTNDAMELAKVILEQDIGGLVIGLPMNMDGSEGPRCDSVRDFARNLIRKWEEFFDSEPEIAFWDERLSSQKSEERMIIHGDLSRKKRAEKIDKMAAAVFLQDALNSLKV